MWIELAYKLVWWRNSMLAIGLSYKSVIQYIWEGKIYWFKSILW
jgi:hypothetical protein